jgi:hypothetical protein
MSNIKSNILGAILAFFSSIALCRLVAFVLQPPNYALVTEISLGVTTGHPLFKAWQSRVLGPYIIKALMFGSVDYVKAHFLFQIITVAVAAFLCWRLGRKYGGSDQSALLALTMFVMCFALLLRPGYLYSWDFIDIIVFILFIDLVLSGMALPWFIVLFAIAIWNRQSAVFIALWLILDPLVRFFYQRQHKLPSPALDWRRMLAGVMCIAIGSLTLELLTRTLLVEATISGDSYSIVPPSADALVLPQNIARLKDSLTHFDRYFAIAIPVFLATVTALGACVVRRNPQRYLALYLVELSFIASIFVIGNLIETRHYLALIPFVVMAVVLLSRPCSTEEASL